MSPTVMKVFWKEVILRFENDWISMLQYIKINILELIKIFHGQGNPVVRFSWLQKSTFDEETLVF